MIIKRAVFISSYTKVKDCPKSPLPEFVFVGRSNVGKSSLINTITNTKKLAKTSSTPGKTQLINHFLINESWLLVDLPGIGYAKASKEKRKKFKTIINEYLLKRENLYCVLMLVNSRLEPQKLDLDLISWMGMNHIPFVIVLTKIDKLSKNKIRTRLNNYQKTLLETWKELPQTFITSSKSKHGKEILLNFIQSLLN